MRPGLRQRAGALELGASLVGLRPEEVGRGRHVAGLIDDPDLVADVVEAGCRREVAGPDLGGIGELALLEPARSAARSAGSLLAAAPSCSRSRCAGTRAEQELARRQQTISSTGRTPRWLAGSNARSDSISSPNHSMRTGQRLAGREDVDDAAAPRELAATGDLGQRLVPEVDQLAQHALLRHALAAA